MFENATLGSFEQIEVRFFVSLTSFPIEYTTTKHRQLAVKIANLSSENQIVKSSEFLTLLSQIDLWIFRALAFAKRWSEMRVKVETAIGNLDDDHARAFLCDVIETCDNKKVSTSGVSSYFKLQHM